MKYWTYFVAKLIAGAAVLDLLWRGVSAIMPPPETFMRQQVKAFPQDLRWTSVMFLFWLLAASFVYLIVWDQKRRCRTCLRRLRMPVESGSWSKATLFNPPRTESICPYGHGTLEEPEVHTSGKRPPEWKAHRDMWQELEELDSRRK